MNLLALDTSTELASVAVLADDKMTYAEQDSQKTHAQLLLPMIDQLMEQSNLHLNQLDGIIFGRGPGSFTGLRIACSVAKGLAYAHGLDLIPVSSLAAIAWSARQQQDGAVLSLLDARMHEVYWGYYAPHQFETKEQVNAAGEIQIPKEMPVILAGVGIDLYWSQLSEPLKAQVSGRFDLFPQAQAMIRLALATGIKAVPAAQAEPIYVRNKVTQGASGG